MSPFELGNLGRVLMNELLILINLTAQKTDEILVLALVAGDGIGIGRRGGLGRFEVGGRGGEFGLELLNSAAELRLGGLRGGKDRFVLRFPGGKLRLQRADLSILFDGSNISAISVLGFALAMLNSQLFQLGEQSLLAVLVSFAHLCQLLLVLLKLLSQGRDHGHVHGTSLQAGALTSQARDDGHFSLHFLLC